MTTPVQLRRIRILIEELEKLRKDNPKGKFNMGIWCALTKAVDRFILRKEILEATKDPCGTVACLAGKAGLIPRIRRMGFKWDPTGRRKAHANFRYREHRGVGAVTAFFGEDVLYHVFRIMTINTLYQGIQALKIFVKERS